MKRILIFTAGFGEGHNTAARNIRDALGEAGRGRCEVEVVDLVARCHPRANQVLRRLYNLAIHRAPRLWGTFYRLVDELATSRQRVEGLGDMRGALEAVLRERPADVLVSVYPAYGYVFAQLDPGWKRRLKRVTVITDSITINSVWYRSECDEYVVPNEPTAEVLRARGVDPGLIRVLGFPVQGVFAKEGAFPPRPDPAVEPRLLYVVNAGRRRAHEVVRRLMEIRDLRLTVCAGNSARVEERIRRVAGGGRAEVMGWTREMPRLLMTHHAVISKAGGATTQEAIAAGCPMIVSQVVPGQEEGNFDLLRSVGGGVKASTPAEIHDAVRDMFDDGAAKWRQMREGLRSIAHPDAALRIAEHLLGIGGEIEGGDGGARGGGEGTVAAPNA
ncbi:MAG: galactosyldiacylglycerol synthase [Verrucomicrobiae bacterium]|nr:galactosyldiacylglycerol synthase [Verrucomicrobiae bacterium]